MATSLAIETEPPLDSNLEQAIQAFKEVREAEGYHKGVSFWGVATEDGNFYKTNTTVCHADLRHIQSRLPYIDYTKCTLINSIQDSPLDIRDQRNWINWLINESMFAQYHISHDVDVCMEDGCVLLDPNTPKNMLALSMFMIRSISEYQNIAEGLITSRLMERGVEAHMAYFLAGWFDYHRGTVSFNPGRNNNHVYLNICDWNWADLTNFLFRTVPGDVGTLWSLDGKYCGISGLFDSPVGDGHNQCKEFMRERFSLGRQHSLTAQSAEDFTTHVSPFIKTHESVRIGKAKGDVLKMEPDKLAEYLVTLIPDITKEVEQYA